MKAVIQRVTCARVSVNGTVVGQIGRGLLVFLGIKRDDTQKSQDHLVKKLLSMRIFPREEKDFDASVVDEGLEILLVSQFTLYGDCSRGNRPSWHDAMPPAEAKIAYQAFAAELKRQYPHIQEGVFGASMHVDLTNDGPVTIVLET